MSNQNSNTLTMGFADWALLFLLGFIWGGSFLFARIAVLEIPPMTLVFLRVAIAAIGLNIFMFMKSSAYQHTFKSWTDFAIMGVLNNIIPFGLIFYGQQEIGAGLAAIVNAMTPIWTLLIAHFTTSDEHLSRGKIVGILLGFVGVAVLIGPDALSGLGGAVVAQLAVLGATISYGFAGVFGKRFARVPPIQTARGQLTMSTIIMLPIAAYADRFWTLPLPSANAVWSVLLLALLCTAYAYILYFKILARSGAVNISLVTLLVPLSAILLGSIVLGEAITGIQLAGMALILLGLLVIDGRLFTRVKK